VQLIGTGAEAYQSVQGATEQNLTAGAVTEDLRAFCSALQYRRIAPTGQFSQDGKLTALVNKCNTVCDSLLKRLESARIPQDARFRGLRAVGKAIRSAMDGDKLRDMQKQLQNIRSEISLRMLGILGDEQSSVSTALRQMATANENMHMDLMHTLHTMQQDLRNALKAPQDEMLRHSADTESDSILTTLERLLRAVSDEGKLVRTSQTILSSLRYNEMPFRHSQIPRKYGTTFAWIFEPRVTPFCKWLKHQNGIFWVGGKAGSGKSTLMKFICDEPKTKQILLNWAVDTRLLVASYFFWNAGYPMQRSQEGLLQSLLYEIMRQAPDLIPLACPRRWRDTNAIGDKWTLEELVQTLDAAVVEAGSSTMFCFFVDGLDEFDGDHYELVKFFAGLTSLPNVKMCVSSRPWNVFTKAYGQSNLSLAVQDLTKIDMDRYITGMLEHDDRFVELAERDKRAWDLVRDIRDRADGVFLWVFLVVRSLLRGLTVDDEHNPLCMGIATPYSRL
jgi:hypothetical protein